MIPIRAAGWTRQFEGIKLNKHSTDSALLWLARPGLYLGESDVARGRAHPSHREQQAARRRGANVTVRPVPSSGRAGTGIREPSLNVRVADVT